MTPGTRPALPSIVLAVAGAALASACHRERPAPVDDPANTPVAAPTMRPPASTPDPKSASHKGPSCVTGPDGTIFLTDPAKTQH